MNDLSRERTPLLIAAEINTIRQQTCKIVLTGAIEIGRRLKEAKLLLKHGEWMKWLEESVSYSQSRANKLMRICEEFSPKLLSSSAEDISPNSDTYTNLTYSQALILLGLPEEEREEFMAEHDVKNMSARELQQVVRQRDEALEGKKQALEQKDQTLKKMGSLQAVLNSIINTITELSNISKSLEQQPEDNEVQCSDDQRKVESEQCELKAAKAEESFSQKLAALDIQLKAEAARLPVLTPDEQFKLHRDNMLKAYDELLKLLNALAKTDPVKKEKYRQEACTIAENMAKTLKVYPPVIKTNLSIN